jgi:DNA-binding transcriptional MerR regulator
MGRGPPTARDRRAGLVMPARQSGNQRFYSGADIERLRRIRFLVEVRGLNIAGLSVTLAVSDRLDVPGPEATRAELRAAVDEASDLSREP